MRMVGGRDFEEDEYRGKTRFREVHADCLQRVTKDEQFVELDGQEFDGVMKSKVQWDRGINNLIA